MRKNNTFLLLIGLCLCALAQAQKPSVYELSSPDSRLTLTVENGDQLQYSLKQGDTPVILPSAIRMTMADGRAWGKRGKSSVLLLPLLVRKSIP